MRDIKRIDRICDKLKELWKKVPDQRFGQLISNYIPINFYMEDTKEDAWQENQYTEYFIDKELERIELWERVRKETSYVKDHDKWLVKWRKSRLSDEVLKEEPEFEDYIKELK